MDRKTIFNSSSSRKLRKIVSSNRSSDRFAEELMSFFLIWPKTTALQIIHRSWGRCSNRSIYIISPFHKLLSRIKNSRYLSHMNGSKWWMSWRGQWDHINKDAWPLKISPRCFKINYKLPWNKSNNWISNSVMAIKFAHLNMRSKSNVNRRRSLKAYYKKHRLKKMT